MALIPGGTQDAKERGNEIDEEMRRV